MPTYLLTFNRLKLPWQNLAAESEQTAQGQPLNKRWSCGNNKSIHKGDRVFLIKQGPRGQKGIMADGWVTSDKSSEKPHWDKEKAAVGEKANYVEVMFERLLNCFADPLLSVADRDGPLALKQAKIPALSTVPSSFLPGRIFPELPLVEQSWVLGFWCQHDSRFCLRGRS